MKLNMTQEPIYTLHIKGKDYSGFKLVSAWEGFVKLQKGPSVVIAATMNAQSPMAKIINDAFSRWCDSATKEDYWIIMASPELLQDFGMVKPEPAKPEPEPDVPDVPDAEQACNPK